MITRDNYQEFFLLYVDNELSAADARAVEEWVAANPDLREEWESLQVCRVDPDEKVVFPGKNSLLRGDAGDGMAADGERAFAAGVGAFDPSMEYLLSYVEGELSPAERREAEVLIAARPADAAELERLLLTVSKPDTSVVFPDKSSLYRKEKDRRVVELRRSVVPRSFSFIPFGPSVPSGILRAVAGAAAVILIAVPLFIKKADHAVTPGGAVALQDKKRATSVDGNPASTAGQTTHEPQVSRGPQQAGEPRQGREPRNIAKAQDVLPARDQDGGVTRPKREPQHGHEAQQAKDIARTRDPRPGTDVAIATLPTATNQEGPVTNLATTKRVSDPITEIKSAQPSVAVRQENIRQNEIPKDQSSFATQALLQEDDEKALASAGQPAPAGKSKLRGLFRKVARTFGSTAERDGEGKREVLISAFQVAVN